MRHLLFDMYHTFYLTNAAHCVIVISIHIVHCSTGRGGLFHPGAVVAWANDDDRKKVAAFPVPVRF